MSTQVRDLFLEERFAELFGTANRLNDIYRFSLVRARRGPASGLWCAGAEMTRSGSSGSAAWKSISTARKFGGTVFL